MSVVENGSCSLEKEKHKEVVIHLNLVHMGLAHKSPDGPGDGPGSKPFQTALASPMKVDLLENVHLLGVVGWRGGCQLFKILPKFQRYVGVRHELSTLLSASFCFTRGTLCSLYFP